MWERGWSFIKRAGTIILLSSIVIWLTSNYGWQAETATAEPSGNEPAAAETVAPDETAAPADEAAPAEETTGKMVFGAVDDMDDSMLGRVGSFAAPIFKPLGFGDWKPTVASVMGLVGKGRGRERIRRAVQHRYRRHGYRNAAGGRRRSADRKRGCPRSRRALMKAATATASSQHSRSCSLTSCARRASRR